MTRNIITSPLSDAEAQQQMEAFKYLNTGYNLYCSVLKNQGFDTDPDSNSLVRSLAMGIVHGEHMNWLAQHLQSGPKDSLRFNHQAGVVPGVTVDQILKPITA